MKKTEKKTLPLAAFSENSISEAEQLALKGGDGGDTGNTGYSTPVVDPRTPEPPTNP